MSQDSTTLTTPDEIQAALDEANKKIKKKRSEKIGVLLDKAADVLSTVLDTTDEAHERMRMQAAEMTINLYTANETAERADRQLDIQAKRLEIEGKKIGINTLLLQQNNVNIANPVEGTQPPPKTLVQNSDGSIVDIDLLARKKAQQMLLDAQLQQTTGEIQEEPEIEEINPLELLEQKKD